MAWWKRRGAVPDRSPGDWNDDPRIPGLIELKRQILNLGDIGRLDLAVSAAEEGASLTRELAAAHPGRRLAPPGLDGPRRGGDQHCRRVLLPTGRRASGWGSPAGLTRVLGLNADILSVAGDPSLACASADHAIHLITSNMELLLAAEQPIVSTLTLLDACRLSGTIHAAQGRWDLALAADEIGVRSAEGLVLVDRVAHAARLAEATAQRDAHLAADLVDEAGADRYRLTLAAALRRAVELGIDGVTAEVLALAPDRPDIQVWAPSLRCDLDVALTRAKSLGLIGLPLLRRAEPAGLRICLEAHAMFAFTFESWDGMSRAHHHHFGPYWTALLRELKQVGDGSPALADDLANWSLMIDRLVSAERHF